MLTELVNDLRFMKFARDLHFEWWDYIHSKKRLEDTNYGKLYALLHYGKADANSLYAAKTRINTITNSSNPTYPDAVANNFPIIKELSDEYKEAPDMVAILLLGFAGVYYEDIHIVMTPPEASKQWGLSKDTVRAALTRGRFDEQIKKGLVRKSGGQWLLNKQAMYEVYGEPKNKIETEE